MKHNTLSSLNTEDASSLTKCAVSREKRNPKRLAILTPRKMRAVRCEFEFQLQHCIGVK